MQQRPWTEVPMIEVIASDESVDDARARSNVVRLAAAQALTGANSAVIFATGSIVGATLAPDISLATVPLSMYVVGLAAGTLPTGAISRGYGRRIAFIMGTGCGVVTGLLAAFAILRGSFVLFCCATFLGGLYGAVSQSYRFAAADGASAAYRPKAVSWGMAGGRLGSPTRAEGVHMEAMNKPARPVGLSFLVSWVGRRVGKGA